MDDVVNSVSLIHQLRMRTHFLHENLERSTQLPQSLRGLNELRSVLCHFLGVYRPVDKLLGKHAGDVIASVPKYVPRSQMLLSDLAQLDMSQQQLVSVPDIQIPSTTSNFQKLGMRYVIEGSALGGRIIRKHIEASEWGPSAQSCIQFFSIDETKTGCTWAAFKTAVDNVESTPSEREDAISGAALLYELLISSFVANRTAYSGVRSNE